MFVLSELDHSATCINLACLEGLQMNIEGKTALNLQDTGDEPIQKGITVCRKKNCDINVELSNNVILRTIHPEKTVSIDHCDKSAERSRDIMLLYINNLASVRRVSTESIFD